MIYVWAILLTCVNGLAWLTNLLSLPGNWLIVIAAVVYGYFLPESEDHGIGWTGIGVLVVLAAVGEVIEFAASAAAAGQRGGSRRGMVLAIVGTTLGSVAGAFVTLPIPLVGPLVGAVAGGAAGAFGGAWLGELWKGRSMEEGLHIGRGALIGRLLGTTGKLAVGSIMVIVAAIDAIY